MDKRFVDSTCGGALLNKTIDEANKVLDDLAKSTRTHGNKFTITTGKCS